MDVLGFPKLKFFKSRSIVKTNAKMSQFQKTLQEAETNEVK